MANNRIYLRCKACGKSLFLGKHFCEGWYYTNYTPDKGTLEEKLNAFYDEHVYCNDYPLECFEIEYEFAPEPLTKSESIRSMTDKELAVWLDDVCKSSYDEGFTSKTDEPLESPYPSIASDWLDWLQQEVTDG